MHACTDADILNLGCVIGGGNSYLPTACGRYLSIENVQQDVAVAQPVQVPTAVTSVLQSFCECHITCLKVRMAYTHCLSAGQGFS